MHPHEEELRALYKREGFLTMRNKEDYDTRGRRVRLDWAAVGDRLPAARAHVELRNLGHADGGGAAFPDAAVRDGLAPGMASDAWVAACKRYIQALPEQQFAALRMYQTGNPVNQWAAAPDARRDERLPVAQKADHWKWWLAFNHADGCVDATYRTRRSKRAALSVPVDAATLATKNRAAAYAAVMRRVCELLDAVFAGAPRLDRELSLWRFGKYPEMLPSNPSAEHADTTRCAAQATTTYMSFSLLSDAAARFAVNNWKQGKPAYLAKVRVPRGARCLFMEMPHSGSYRDDFEVVFGRNQCFTATDEWHAEDFLSTYFLKWSRSKQLLVAPFADPRVLVRNYTKDVDPSDSSRKRPASEDDNQNDDDEASRWGWARDAGANHKYHYMIVESDTDDSDGDDD